MQHVWEAEEMLAGIWWGKSKGKRQLERTNPTWEANNKMDLSEVGWGCVDWIDLVQDKNRWWALAQ